MNLFDIRNIFREDGLEAEVKFESALKAKGSDGLIDSADSSNKAASVKSATAKLEALSTLADGASACL